MKLALLIMAMVGVLTAADATGKWTGSLLVQAQGGEKPGPAYLVLKQDGQTLTGTAGPNADEQHPITNGKAENGTLTFEVPTGETVMKFALRHDGDEIKGDVSREREGRSETAKLAVKREP